MRTCVIEYIEKFTFVYRYCVPSGAFSNCDTAFCVPASMVLTPKVIYPGYTWNTGSHDDTIVINSSGIYPLYFNAGDGFEKYLWNTSDDDQLLLVHKNGRFIRRYCPCDCGTGNTFFQ